VLQFFSFQLILAEFACHKNARRSLTGSGDHATVYITSSKSEIQNGNSVLFNLYAIVEPLMYFRVVTATPLTKI